MSLGDKTDYGPSKSLMLADSPGDLVIHLPRDLVITLSTRSCYYSIDAGEDAWDSWWLRDEAVGFGPEERVRVAWSWTLRGSENAFRGRVTATGLEWRN